MAAITPAINDQALTVQSYQNKQLNDLKVRHLARFRRIALRLLGNIADAEDAVQDAFLSAFKQLDQFKGQAEMSTWLAAIVIDVARMELRRRFTAGANCLHETHGELFCSQRYWQTATKPRRAMLQAGTCRKTRQRDNTTPAYLA